MSEYPMKLEELNKSEYGQPLVCSGCSHCASDAEFPGFPSGERPCHFCLRNVLRERWQKEMEINTGKGLICWYDGVDAWKVPMDCYHSIDMKVQFSIWKDTR